ncbi:hypothetical protein TBLA_0C05970 [Henningerozyma blattae CBS 6284]|uniref:Uncharacterized protein n=1 Tax=Henningerozyma blattae (strain ATCC 34711 / CBS 6284 / DSM 70876 / NBRC 10599 / NRRL Y-10934 / UCD 77-7) TaxID=1071380 RepID=I2H1Z2_HENB6|nr:hypothetical protein TBLA_0C05970 [Tetrapisispora blattae CBS 6284]CCH60394.1 hypothetical protein TBLA_0C05970 [Tetrapisispora blattae CBS 6284]
MSTYIRGPLCGIDNCPSRLWRILAGHRTCQYGHVMEGDYEFNDDEDVGSGNAITRRLNLTTNATGNFQSSISLSQSQSILAKSQDKKVYGSKGRLIFVKSFQWILKRQSDWIVKKTNNQLIDRFVKNLWMMYLKSIDGKDEVGLSLVSSISILLIACTQLHISIYTSDFQEWITNGDLLYFKANEKIPSQWRETMPNYYLKILEGGSVPTENQIQNNVLHLLDRLNFEKYCGKLQLSMEPLIFKLILEFTLPCEFFSYVSIAIKDRNDLLEYENVAIKNKVILIKHHPEFRILCYFYFIVTSMLSYDEEIYSTKWLNRYLQIQKDNEEPITMRAIRFDRDVYDWDANDTQDYLKWIETKFLPMQGTPEERKNGGKINIDQRIAKRKLYKMIPIPDTSSETSAIPENINKENNDKIDDENNEMNSDRKYPTKKKGNLTYIGIIQDQYLKLNSDFLNNDEIVSSNKNREQIIDEIKLLYMARLRNQFGISKAEFENGIAEMEQMLNG